MDYIDARDELTIKHYGRYFEKIEMIGISIQIDIDKDDTCVRSKV